MQLDTIETMKELKIYSRVAAQTVGWPKCVRFLGWLTRTGRPWHGSHWHGSTILQPELYFAEIGLTSAEL
jgi:hypothetical protein